MGILSIDGHMLRKALIAAANELEKNKDYIDSLNVFPVPDGDTGINMSLTTIAAAREVEKLNTPNVYEVAKAAASGSLRGARGNSGVILSQLFRGFAKGLEGKATATSEDIAYACMKGSEMAYKAVMKPKEGTILTVSREFAEFATESSLDTDDVMDMVKASLDYAFKILDKTIDMLPELKAANVFDAGGRGLLYIIEGAYNSVSIEGEIALSDPAASKSLHAGAMPLGAASTERVDIMFGYCTEFFINVDAVTEKMEEDLKKYLESMGDSIVVVADDDIIKVHVHTNNPGNVLERALKIGALSNMKIENMRIQHTNLINFSQTTEEGMPEPKIESMPHKETAFMSVVAGDGLSELFKNLGAAEVIEGGQTMNPSIEDILAVIEQVNADDIFVMPNNKNIILAAQQAAEFSEKNVHVIPSKSVPQGVSAILSYVPGFSAEENMQSIEEAMATVATGQVTYAVRATNYEDKEINDGDILGILDGKINFVEKDVEETAKKLIDDMFEKSDGEVMSIYNGEGVSNDEAGRLMAYVEEKYPDCEVSLTYGGQPLYYYIISLE